jgi:hypothetical protein
MPASARCRGAGAAGAATGGATLVGADGRGRAAGCRAGARDSPRAPLEPAATGRPHAGAAHVYFKDRKRQSDSHAGLAGEAGVGPGRGRLPPGARCAQPARGRGGRHSGRPIPGGACGAVAAVGLAAPDADLRAGARPGHGAAPHRVRRSDPALCFRPSQGPLAAGAEVSLRRIGVQLRCNDACARVDGAVLRSSTVERARRENGRRSG